MSKPKYLVSRRFLLEVKDQMERDALMYSSEVDTITTVPELIEKGFMPEIYDEVVNLLESRDAMFFKLKK